MPLPCNVVGFAIGLNGSSRLPRLRRVLDEAGLEDVTIRLSDRDYEDGMRGCFSSHVGAAAAGLHTSPALVSIDNTDKEAAFVFVCEDDVEFQQRGGISVVEAISEACNALATTEVDCIGLGGLIIGRVRSLGEGHPNVVQCPWNCAHAYVLKRESARNVASWTYTPPNHRHSYGMGVHFDQQLARRLCQGLVVPTVAFQCGKTEEVTTTATNSPLYVIVQSLQWLITPKLPQIVLEKIFLLIFHYEL